MPSGQAVAPAREDSLTERLGQRVRSRLYEMCRTVEIASPDYRARFGRRGGCDRKAASLSGVGEQQIPRPPGDSG